MEAAPKARVAEWFKATDLRPVIIDAWVRTPPRARMWFNCNRGKIELLYAVYTALKIPCQTLTN